MSKAKTPGHSAGHHTRSRAVDQTGASDPDSIPSTLDPDLDTDATDIERELAEHDRERHVASEDELPEEEIADEVQHAAEGLPADTPVDRADQTDKRMENPPSHPER